MKRFIVHLNDGEFLNVPADRMEIKENFVFAWKGEELVDMVDISAIISAHISTQAEKACCNEAR